MNCEKCKGEMKILFQSEWYCPKDCDRRAANTKTATLVLVMSSVINSQAVYKCSPPLDGNEYVFVSFMPRGVRGPESIIAPGKPEGWASREFIRGPYYGQLSHAEVLGKDGYTIVEEIL